jgi:UDP-N-acetylglucosamine:LPS N-acetylglucosamine transferase
MGGHLELLKRLRHSFASFSRTWVTAAEAGADDLRRQGEGVIDVSKFSRARPFSAVRNMVSSLSLALEHRPRVVVATGAGSIVAFCLFSRLLGARVIFVETMARITSPSASGRVLSRIASRTLVQWPEMGAVYPRATVCRPALLEDIATRPAPPGEGCLVAVGTHRHPFDRLLSVVDRAVGAGVLPAPVRAQSGYSSYRPTHYSSQDFLNAEELETAIEASEYVICHAGSGLIAAALRAGRKPLVLARRPSLGEH